MLSWAPALSCMALIFWLSSLPGDRIPLPGFQFSDKLIHFLAYMVLGALIGIRLPLHRRLEARGRPDGSITGNAPVSVAPAAPGADSGFLPADRAGALTGILYGASDEIHQIFVPLREFSVGDFSADALGILAGLRIVRRLAARAEAATAAG